MPRPDAIAGEPLRKVHSADAAERQAAFQALSRMGDAAVPGAKGLLDAGARFGFPLAAILVINGEIGSVPLEVRARHLAVFRWPRPEDIENAVVEPYAWNAIERELVRTGRPALRLLARALARETPTEEKALQAVRVMLRIGGRAAAEEFAGLLDVDREFDGIKVSHVGAVALLYLGRRELELRGADRDAQVEAARRWWETAKGQTEDEWLRAAVSSVAERAASVEGEGLRPVLELLAGEAIGDARGWREKHLEWAPRPGPLHAGDWVPLLLKDRPAAFDANRRLEELTGARLDVPRLVHLGDLAAALRLWQPSPGLHARWRRYLESAQLRLSITIIGFSPARGANDVIASYEKYFNASEDPTGSLAAAGSEGQYLIHAHPREGGTRLLLSEYFLSAASTEGYTRDLPGDAPALTFSAPFRSCAMVAVEEAPSRQPPRPPETNLPLVRARLKALAQSGPEALRARALRALGYCQEAADAEYLKSCGAGEALLLLGHPDALAFRPSLETHEIEMAMRVAKDPAVVAYLIELRRR